MKVIAVLLLVVSASTVTPVQKVVQLLNGMTEKGKEEKHAEQVQFAAYKQFCDDTTVQKQRDIKEANQEIEQLEASIQKNEADAATLSKEIAQLDEDISVYNGDRKAATEIRNTEAEDYAATHKDYSESVDALERAIQVLKKQSHDRPQALLELTKLPLIPKQEKKALTAFLSQVEQDPLDVSAPEANAYEFQSSHIVDMLDKLLDKFRDERTTLEKDESEARHAYEMLVQDLTAQTETATTDREDKAATKAGKLQTAAENKGDLADTTETRDADQNYLENLSSTCAQKSQDFESRQQLRTEELAAIEKAVEILSSGAVSGAADKHLPSFVQKKSLAQLRAARSNGAQQKVADFLKAKSEALNSRILSALAVRVSEDPFSKVKKMIKDLVVRLMEEANEEAEHKGWCDTELTANEATRKEKTSAVESLHAEIDELTASVAKLSQDLTDLAQQIAELDKAVAEATEIRSAAKAENKATIKDSQDAQTAVAQAVQVLSEFYEKAGEATAFVQQQPESPAIFDTEYKGMQSESGGVLGMLEVIQSDFARLETDTKASEDEDSRSHEKFLSESAVTKAAASKDVEHKTAKRTSQEGALVRGKEDLKGTQKELDAALAYYDKLKPSCVDAGVSYEERVERRKQEIESLQEALRILNGEDLA